MSYQLELAVRQYLAAFDGTNKVSHAEFESLFNNLHHKDYTFVGLDGKVGTRDELLEMESRNFANGTKMTLIHFRKIGLDCVDIKVHLVNENGDNASIRVINTIKGTQIIKAHVIDESAKSNLFFLSPTNLSSCGSVMKAKYASNFYKWKDFGTYGTNM